MFLVYLAAVSSALALISGIAAVGSGHHWHFTHKDIFAGKRNAVLYVWVTFSSIFSLAHLTSLTGFGLEYNWQYKDSETALWMVIHSGAAILLIAAHLFIKRTLTTGTGDEYVWGPNSVSE